MIKTGFETRVKINQIVESQLPSFILEESPNVSKFLKQYYLSQEYQGGPSDISENLDQYLRPDNLTPEVIVDSTITSGSIDVDDTVIFVSSTKGFPQEYGLLKIDDEIITYTGITSNSFTGCVRGFSGITNYHNDLDSEELVFTTSSASQHTNNTPVQNLSSLFLKEFFKKLRYTFTPGLENLNFSSKINVGNFIREAKSFYQSKGTDESFRILFNVLYGVNPKVVNLEDYLLKPSVGNYVRREIVITECINSGNPLRLVGQNISKSSDDSTFATISEVEIFTRRNRQYYKVSLFIGFNDVPSVEGSFNITQNTKCLENVAAGSSVIPVDSTIGFSKSGTLISGENTFTYTDKTINQFLGCTITSDIQIGDDIRTNEYFYGYEDGNTEKEVRLKIIGTISGFTQVSDSLNVSEGDIISVKNLGEVINNPSREKTYKEIFSNSWIYNTSTRYQIKNSADFDGATSVTKITVLDEVDRSNFKKGDEVEILIRNSNTVYFPRTIDQEGVITILNDTPYITGNVSSNNEIDLSSGYIFDPDINYDIRRKIRKAYSTNVNIEYGNNIISDIQNVYSDEEYMYVASNSLPSDTRELQNIPYSYRITKELLKISSTGTVTDKEGEDEYTSILFDGSVSVPFIDGDKIYYQSTGTPIIGLENNTAYFVKKVDNLRIKLYSARSFVGSSNYLKFKESTNEVTSSTHTFTLFSQKENIISPQKILRKYPLSLNKQNKDKDKTLPGQIGLLINGVEITNYKSDEKVYFGPLTKSKVLNSGEGYDVINLPKVDISDSSGSGALIQPVVSGSIEKIYIDTQDYDINNVVSIDITGGNGRGASVDYVLRNRSREVFFDARETTKSGGINTTGETITFLTDHNFNDYDEVFYNNNGNQSVGIGPSDSVTTTLSNNAAYFVEVLNSKAIKLFESKSDAISGINAVNFNSINKFGIHKFVTVSNKKTISEIKIINGGSDYTNRKLIVKPSGISTSFDTVSFKNHNFKDGDLITYNYETSGISGLSTSNQYYVLLKDSDTFRLCDAGIGGTSKSNFERGKYETFTTTGSGYQYFSYPDIKATLKYTTTNSNTGSQSSINETSLIPIVRGSIIDTYLYESGTGYGSEIISFEKKPVIKVKTGQLAALKPNIINGSLTSVSIEFGGRDYNSTPDLIVEDSSGSGSGAQLRPVLDNGRIKKVIVINPGVGYSENTTSIRVVSSGKNAVIDSEVRSLTINNTSRFGKELLLESNLGNNLQYSICGYSKDYLNVNESTSSHSPIIGWAYDGNPIYGPFGYEDPEVAVDGTAKALESGYEIDVSYIDRNNLSFENGFFIEDYKFTNNGDLDEHNGRFGKTPDFPNGVYAYFAPIDATEFTPIFPYFIGNTYKSPFIVENAKLTQDFDFNNSPLVRNTFPYRASGKLSSYDFVYESNEIKNHKVVIESVSSGTIEQVEISNPGRNYKVDDAIKFDNTGTNGEGFSASVFEVKGKEITSLTTNISSYPSSIFTWNNAKEVKVIVLPSHTLSSYDNVTISGFGTESNLNGTFDIDVTSHSSSLLTNIPSTGSINVADIYVSNIPGSLRNGSLIGIGTEYLTVLNIFPEYNVLRVKRGLVNVGHSTAALVNYIPDSFTFSIDVDHFDSKVNDKVYFNPTKSIGFGTAVGISTFAEVNIGITTQIISLPSKSIYLNNHPFKNNQKVRLSIPVGVSSFSISTTTDANEAFFFPDKSLLSQDFFVINKGPNLIGIKTEIGLDSPEVFILGGGDNNDEYFIESDYQQEIGKVELIKSTVAVSTSHGLSKDDKVTLTVNPNISVGIGNSSQVHFERDESGVILANRISFTSSAIDTDLNVITLQSHNLETGDKVKYTANQYPSGLSSATYYVYKIDRDQIQLCETYIDTQSDPPLPISITTVGGSEQSISSVNPKISIVKNNDLVIGLSSESLSGYNLKIFYDQQYSDEFVSSGLSTDSNVLRSGTPGIDATASLTIKHDKNLPDRLYYNLEKSGYISTSDTDVKNYSEISFVDSAYSNEYSIASTTETTFDIILKEYPEKTTYYKSETDSLEYTTNSKSVDGPIHSVKINSTGYGYKKVPVFSSVNSVNGSDALIIPKSNAVGDIREIRFLNDRFEYPSDKTLQPEAFISPYISIQDANTIGIVTVTSGGSGYVVAPNIRIVDKTTKEEIDTGLFEVSLAGESIQRVDIINEPKGLPDTEIELFAVDNTNGVAITKIESGSSGIFTCFITTPINATTYRPFKAGDQVYVEGVVKKSSDGTGFNSEDYGYEFFTVNNYYSTSSPHRVEIDITGLSTNPGIAKTIQDSVSTIINRTDYPTFEFNKLPNTFEKEEKLIVNNDDTKDINVADSGSDYIKIFGTDSLSVGDIIVGRNSKSKAKVQKLQQNLGRFDVTYSLTKNIGWNNSIGRLSDDSQYTPDNDYYQNLSYTIKSPIEYDTLKSTVNNLVHTSGLKNFADLDVTKSSVVGFNSINATTITKDFISENRVDTWYNFDFVKDIDVTGERSKFIKFKNRDLIDHVNINSDLVLNIDDTSSQFANLRDAESPDLFIDISEIVVADKYTNFLIRVTNTSTNEFNFVDLNVLFDGFDSFLIENGNLSTSINNNEVEGEFSVVTDSFYRTYLRFSPNNPYDYDYDLKIHKREFINSEVGISTFSLQNNDLISSTQVVASGQTSIIVSDSSSTYAYYGYIQVFNETTNEINFVNVFVTHNGTDTYISESFADSGKFGSKIKSLNFDSIGAFEGNINQVSGDFEIKYINNTNNSITIKANILSFHSQNLNSNTYEFKSEGQSDSSARSIRYKSPTSVSLSSDTVIESYDSTIFNAANIVVYYNGNSQDEIHHLKLVVDPNGNPHLLHENALTTLDDGVTGITTFSVSESSGNVEITMHKSSADVGETSNVFSEIFYISDDRQNIPLNLDYGSVSESVSIIEYNGINAKRGNKTQFALNRNNTPIFAKIINPEIASQNGGFNTITGTFNIEDHFFRNNEELIYTPKSTFEGVTASSMRYYDSDGVENDLPSQVFAIVNNEDSFQIATTQSGIAVTFAGIGAGNAHQFEMFKKNEKVIISLDNLIQSPLLYTPTSHQLNGSITDTETTFALTGISTINPNDILKINNEYLNVIKVGFGTTASGPINGIGNSSLVKVERGFVGSSATEHGTGSEVRVYKGSFNIVDSNIHFVAPPRGRGSGERDSSNLIYPRSQFGGRVYLRNDYSTNRIYDDISSDFTGIDNQFNLSVNGISTSGIGSTGGNGIVIVNGFFQTPTTINNPGNNFIIDENNVAGVSTIVFSGITKYQSNEILRSEEDFNSNRLPRGGVVVSLGSSGGLGYAPLSGARIAITTNTSGELTAVDFVETTSDGKTLVFYGSGYSPVGSTVNIGVNDLALSGNGASISATVGLGGSLTNLSFVAGSGYMDPIVEVPQPSYNNLNISPISRIGVGETTELGKGLQISVDIGAASTSGIGSTHFEVKSFDITRNGFSFQRGDKFTLVGLVTDARLSDPIDPFVLEVTEIYNDSCAIWQFGEMDYIDSIKLMQDGSRVNFPLYYNEELLSFESSTDVNFANLLLIFRNGVLQQPGLAYNFEGGSSFNFTNAPTEDDKVDIFFYKGTVGDDTQQKDIIQILESGDEVRISQFGGVDSQNNRTIYRIVSSDRIETNFYTGSGINESVDRPINLIRQKRDKKVNGLFETKERDSIESLIYPTANIIGNVGIDTNIIFVDSVDLFNDNVDSNTYSAIIVDTKDGDPVSASLTAIVSAGGTIAGINTITTGRGYSSAPTISILAPVSTGITTVFYPDDINPVIGVGSIAKASATIDSNGSLDSVSITNPGFGYSQSNPPKVLVSLPTIGKEVITKIDSTFTTGYSGFITSIREVVVGSDSALEFTLYAPQKNNPENNISSQEYEQLKTNYPFYVFDTHVGNGVTSTDSDGNIVSIGSSYVNNIYNPIDDIVVVGSVGIVTCKVHSDTSIVGIATTGSNQSPVGRFSWGKISGGSITRSSDPISITINGASGLVVTNSGISSFPTIQRRGDVGLRKSGALNK